MAEDKTHHTAGSVSQLVEKIIDDKVAAHEEQIRRDADFRRASVSRVASMNYFPDTGAGIDTYRPPQLASSGQVPPSPRAELAAPVTTSATATLVASEVVDDFATARDWITTVAKRMKTAGEIRADVTQTALSKELAARMYKANEAYQHAANGAHKDKIIKTGMSMPRPVGYRHIRNNLREWGLWPVSDIK